MRSENITFQILALSDLHPFMYFVAQPFAEQWGHSVRAIRSLPNIGLLWAFQETLFAISFGHASGSPREVPRSTELFRQTWTVDSDVNREEILVYFDYEGLWSRWALDSNPITYPRGFPPLKRIHSYPKDGLIGARSFLYRPLEFERFGMHSAILSPDRLSRREKRLLEEGTFFQRTLPNLSEIPPVQGSRLRHLVFITGYIRPGQSPRDLYARLDRGARVSPYLYTFDSERVLLAALSPAPPHISRSREPVIDALRESLERIEVVREPIDSLLPVIDHRYD